MRIKAIMLKETLGNMATPGFRVGEECKSIEPVTVEGMSFLKVKLDKDRGYGRTFGDWLVPSAGIIWVEILTPEEEEAVVKAEAEAAAAAAKKDQPITIDATKGKGKK